MRRKSLIHISRIKSRLAVTAAPLGALICALLLSPATPLVPVAEAKVARDLVFIGNVERGGPVAFRISGNGRVVKRATASLSLDCSDGDGFTFDDKWVRLPVRRGSRIAASVQNSWLEDDIAFEASFSLHARVDRRRRKVAGTWQVAIAMRDINTDETVSCDSGPARFTARR